jgi:hypothetical protein
MDARKGSVHPPALDASLPVHERALGHLPVTPKLRRSNILPSHGFFQFIGIENIASMTWARLRLAE